MPYSPKFTLLRNHHLTLTPGSLQNLGVRQNCGIVEGRLILGGSCAHRVLLVQSVLPGFEAMDTNPGCRIDAKDMAHYAEEKA